MTTLDKVSQNPYVGKVGLQQRVLPEYRAAFLDLLAGKVNGGLKVIAGDPRPIEQIRTVKSLDFASLKHASNRHFLSGQFYLCFQLGLIDWVREADPDLLVLEANPRYPFNLLAQGWMHRRGRPVIGWGLGVPWGGDPVSRLWRGVYLKAFDGLIAYSRKGAYQYQKMGFPAEKVFVALNAVYPAPRDLPERTVAQDGPARVIFVGRLQTRKRVDLLLEACAKLETQPELIIVGEGPERARLTALAEEIYPATQFKGPVYGDDLHRLLQSADLFALPGTGGLALQEAMANALPVIAAEGDGTQADLVGEENGWLIQPGDRDQMVHVLEEALNNRERLRSMGKASFEIVREQANIGAMVNVFLQAFHSVTLER